MASPFKVWWSLVHPVFMVAAIASAVMGSLLSKPSDLISLLVLCTGVFSGLYYAHVKDAYVDYYLRKEDAAPAMSRKQTGFALRASITVFALALAYLYLEFGLVIIALMLGGAVMAHLHAPFLDLSPVGATAGYPTGLAFATLSGYYIQARSLDAKILLFTLAVWLMLNAVKLVDDIKDYEWDRAHKKITGVVWLGKRKAKPVAVFISLLGVSSGYAFGLLGAYSFATGLGFLAAAPFFVLSLRRNRRDTLFGLDYQLIGVYAFTAIELAIAVARI